MAQSDLSPTTRCWLNYEVGSAVQKGANTGQVGKYLRSISTYCDETILQFDLTGLAGGTVTDVDLDVVFGSPTWPGSSTVYLYEQDKTAPASWTSPNPKWDDFANSSWGTTLDSLSVGGSGTQTFNSSSLTSLVQDWVDNSSNNWGVILGAGPNFFSYYATVTGATLKVTYTDAGGAVQQISFNYRQRRV